MAAGNPPHRLAEIAGLREMRRQENPDHKERSIAQSPIDQSRNEFWSSVPVILLPVATMLMGF